MPPTTDETFPNPPITEALIDIQVVLPAETDLKKLESFQGPVEQRFPNKRQRATHTFQLNLGAAPESKSPQATVQGFMFTAADQTKVVQAGLTSFTFNKLKPYERWEAFSSEARELWDRYLSLAKPVNIRRIALRYINRIDLPLPIGDLAKFFTIAPKPPPGLSSGVGTFFMQMTLKDRTSPAEGIITQTFKPFRAETKALTYILDIDVSSQFEVLAPDTEIIWQHLSSLRRFKNDIFFASTTDETKKLFR